MVEDVTTYLIAGGLIVGLVYGLLLKMYKIDMMQAVDEITTNSNHRLATGFAAMFIVAVIGTYLLEDQGVDIAKSGYRNSQFDWLGVILGGVIFGIGARLAGQDAAHVVVRAASGYRQSMLVLGFFIIFAAITQFGLLEPVRLFLTGLTAITLTTDAGLASITGLPAWLPVVVVSVLMAFYIIKNWRRGTAVPLLIAGAILGLLVVGGWYLTGVLAFDEFNPKAPSGISASGPMSRIGVMVLAGDTPKLSYAISFVIGLAIMGFIYSLLRGKFRFTAIPHGKVNVSALGGSLMGIGGTVAYGCNVGQGLTGFSTLSIESILAVIAMYIGAYLAAKKRWGG